MCARVALTFIYKNDANDILPMLESTLAITDFVVAVDTGSTDGTTDVIKKFYTSKDVPLVVLNHAWDDNFANARNVGFKYIQESEDKFDWISWFDTDDELINAAGVREFVDRCITDNININCIELNYHYMFDDYNNVVIEHFRERFLRTSVPWYWSGAVHEWLEHTDKLKVMATPQFVVKHRRQFLDRPISPTRNLAILLKELEKNPTDARNLIYVGHEYTAMGDKETANTYYQKYLKYSKWPDERGQVLCKIGSFLVEQGRIDEAMTYYAQALLDIPDWPDPYLRLGEACLRSNNLDKALYWANVALSKPAPETQLVVNPLDYKITPYVLKGYTYSLMGNVDEAIKAWNVCCEKLPNTKEYLNERDNMFKERYRRSIVEAFMRMSQFIPSTDILDVVRSLPEGVLQDSRVKDVVVAAIKGVEKLNSDSNKVKSVSFFCGVLPYAWSPRTLDSEGLGGTETAVISVAKILADNGWRVTVYAEPGKDIGMIDGVMYLPATHMDITDPVDVFVSVRYPQILPSIPAGTRRVLWCHDVSLGSEITKETDSCTDAYMFVSKWQMEQYLLAYSLDEEKCAIIGNGIDLNLISRAMSENHKNGIIKNTTKFIWPSSPDRGLDYLLSIWPMIKQITPSATLDIYYGWDLYVKLRGDAYKIALEQLALEVGGDSITWHGRVGKMELYKAYAESGVWLYPSRFEETFAISALEAMSFGVYPIVNDKGALKELIKYGKVIKGHATKGSVAGKYLDAYSGYCDMDEAERKEALTDAAKYALTYTWEAVVEKVERVLNNEKV